MITCATFVWQTVTNGCLVSVHSETMRIIGQCGIIHTYFGHKCNRIWQQHGTHKRCPTPILRCRTTINYATNHRHVLPHVPWVYMRFVCFFSQSSLHSRLRLSEQSDPFSSNSRTAPIKRTLSLVCYDPDSDRLGAYKVLLSETHFTPIPIALIPNRIGHQKHPTWKGFAVSGSFGANMLPHIEHCRVVSGIVHGGCNGRRPSFSSSEGARFDSPMI